jgi:hypothetical protein
VNAVGRRRFAEPSLVEIPDQGVRVRFRSERLDEARDIHSLACSVNTPRNHPTNLTRIDAVNMYLVVKSWTKGYRADHALAAASHVSR